MFSLKRKLTRFGLWMLLLLVVAYGAMALTAQPATQTAFLRKADTGVLLIAHKGGEGLAPGNTLEAFKRGLQEGADILETDARLTADGHIVLFHDDDVSAMTDGQGAIETLTLAQVKALDAGYRWTADGGKTFPYRGQGTTVPTLGEVLATFPEARFNIDMKTHTPEMVTAMAAVVSDAVAGDRVLVTSFDGQTVREFRRLMPDVTSSLASDETRTFFVYQLLRLSGAYTPPAEALQVPEFEGSLRVVSQHFIDAAHARGLQSHVWTVNDESDMRRFIDMGADGIITDYPDVLRRVINGQ